MKKITAELVDRTIDVEVYIPEGAQSLPGILLLHEIGGILDFYRKDAEDLAEKGYLVYLPNLYTKDALKHCVRALVTSSGRKNSKDNIPNQEISKLLDQLKNDPVCNGKLGMLGACYSGGFVIQMAKRNDMLAPVLYHHSVGLEGAGVPNDENLDDVERLQAHWSKFDPFCPAARQRKLKSILNDRLDDHYYNMPHGFRSVSRGLKGSKLVWDRTIKFFNDNLQ